MAVTPAGFRQEFPQFNDPEVYSDAVINIWNNRALLLLDATRWGTLLDYGCELFIAHRLTLVQRDILTNVVPGTTVGMTQGVLTAKAVDKVSASYDANAVIIEGAGQWNMTRFGIELYQYMKDFGAGGFQAGAPGGGGFGFCQF